MKIDLAAVSIFSGILSIGVGIGLLLGNFSFNDQYSFLLVLFMITNGVGCVSIGAYKRNGLHSKNS